LSFARGLGSIADSAWGAKRSHGGKRVHIVSPLHNLAILDGDDRDEPVVIGCASRDHVAMHLVFDDHDTRILGSVDDERVRAVKDDIVTIARIEHHERVTTAECPRPSGENISKLEFSVVGDGIKIVVAIDETDQTLLDYAEERVEPREGRVLWIGAFGSPVVV